MDDKEKILAHVKDITESQYKSVEKLVSTINKQIIIFFVMSIFFLILNFLGNLYKTYEEYNYQGYPEQGEIINNNNNNTTIED